MQPTGPAPVTPRPSSGRGGSAGSAAPGVDRHRELSRPIAIPPDSSPADRAVIVSAGVTPVDWKVRSGEVRDVLPVDLPAIPGRDGMGRAQGARPAGGAYCADRRRGRRRGERSRAPHRGRRIRRARPLHAAHRTDLPPGRDRTGPRPLRAWTRSRKDRDPHPGASRWSQALCAGCASPAAAMTGPGGARLRRRQPRSSEHHQIVRAAPTGGCSIRRQRSTPCPVVTASMRSWGSVGGPLSVQARNEPAGLVTAFLPAPEQVPDVRGVAIDPTGRSAAHPRRGDRAVLAGAVRSADRRRQARLQPVRLGGDRRGHPRRARSGLPGRRRRHRPR